MKAIHLTRVALSIGRDAVTLDMLDRLAASLARLYRVSCHVREETVEAAPAFAPERNQFHSTAILKALGEAPLAPGAHILGITNLDLFVPVLTFVFGEAQLGGRCAVVSTYRLREEAYGLPQNQPILDSRLLKEAVHELGHTQGLRHCPDWRCAMASTHAVERLDLKEPTYCRACAAAVS
jgi:archaemetzincin